MGRNFWKFASILEKDFGVVYDREEEFVTCPECEEPLYGCDWDLKDYASTTSDGYLVYRCPVCGEVLTVIELDK